MKSQLSSFDIAALVLEFQQCIGLRVEKVFLQGYDDLYLRFTGIKEKKTISLKLGKSMWLEDGFRTTDNAEPPRFAMLLRKYIGGKALESVSQHGFDRIVVFQFQDGFRLIAEMFGTGNVILVEEQKIIQPLTSRSWRAREVKPGFDYQFPPESPDPFSLSMEELAIIISGSGKDLVRCLATEVNLGGAHAEEICHSLARDKKDKASELSEDEISEIHEIIITFRDMLAHPQPEIVYDDEGGQMDVLPFGLSMHSDREKKQFESFSQAVFEYFANLPENAEKGPEKSPRQLQLERQLASQQEAISELEKQAIEFQETGDGIYANYTKLDKLLAEARMRLSGGNWQATKQAILGMQGVVNFDPDNGLLFAELEDAVIKLDVRLDLNENAASYYDRSKKARHKLDGAVSAASETQGLLEEAEEAHLERMDSTDKSPTKRFWFDKFRWFLSSQGHMVVAGRDARTNDQVVKKHLKDGDLYAHADINGAPSTVIKGATAEDEQTLHEACMFAVAHSRAWKGKMASGSAYWVKPDQVSKTPQPGEFLARGAFVIRGKRNYSKKLELRLAVGDVLIDGERKIMCGPESALMAHTSRYHIIEPGDEKRTAFSKLLSDEYKVPIEEIDRILPPGDIRVIK